MVVTRFPATLASGDTHERIALPSRCTVHAPFSLPEDQELLFPKKPGLSTLLCKRHLLWPVCNATNGSRHVSVDSALWGGKPCVWLSATLPPRHFDILLPRFWRDTMHRSGCRRGCTPGTHAEGKSAEKTQARVHRPGFEARADSHAGRSRASRSKKESANSSSVPETARSHGRPIASSRRAP